MARWRRRVKAAASSFCLAWLVSVAPHTLADPAQPADPVPSPALNQADGVPHLPSPDHLPPGTTQTAPERSDHSYLRDVWEAVRSHDVSISEALLLIAQRPMDTPG